jgi:hypothetical protein
MYSYLQSMGGLARGASRQDMAALGRMAGGDARQAVNKAVGRAGAAFGKVSPFMPAVGGVLAVAGAGLEAKSRLDRGEDLQRAATGAATGLAGSIAGGAQGAAIGTAFGGPVGTVIGGLVGAAAGGLGAGYLTDRATDFVRGNDGKGTDAVRQDLERQIQQAQAQGNPARARELLEVAAKFTNSRQLAGSQAANNSQMAQQYGVQQSDATEFGNLNSAQKMEKYLAESQFASQLDQDTRSYNQRFGQQQQRDLWNQQLTDKERRRNQAIVQQNEAVKTQQGIIGGAPALIQRSFGDYAQASASTQMGGIR